MSQAAMLNPLSTVDLAPPRVAQFDENYVRLLTFLRQSALDCRCSAKEDALHAGQAFTAGRAVSDTTPACLLVKALRQLLGRPARFYSPGVKNLSEDETWLLRLLVSVTEDDRISAEFLLRSRVPAQVRRSFRTLVANVCSTHLELE